MYTLDSLAELADSSPNDVRYYIQRGLLPPPFCGNLGSYFSDEHLERLHMIVNLANEGVSLSRIRQCLDRLDQNDPSYPPEGNALATRRQSEQIFFAETIFLQYPIGFFSTEELTRVGNFFQQLLDAKKEMKNE